MVNSSALLHPVRLRIVQALLGGPGLTTLQIHERLRDVPIATLYRHVAQLVEHGLIEITDEQQIRGASEKTYCVAPGLANPTAGELKSLSSEELLTVFTVFTSGIISDFDNYIHDADHDLVADQVSFAQADFWATNEEVDAFVAALMAALGDLRSNGSGAGRRRRKLTTVLLPQAETPSGEPA
ncbi:helix-turn-helix domain-containing protein [Rhodoglobus sp. NPDC076762]